MQRLTPSRVRDYQACALKFKLTTLDGLGPKDIEQTAPLCFGNSIHAALDTFHRPGARQRTADAETLLRQHWKLGGYRDAGEEAQYFQRGVQALTQYLQAKGIPEGDILRTECFLRQQVKLDGRQVELSAKADRIELLPGDVLKILDYKTHASGEIPSAGMLACDLPTFLYYTLARLAYPQYKRVMVAQLNVLTLAETAVEYTPEEVTANKQALIELIDQIERGEFEARPNGHCAWCPVRSYCPFFGPEVNLDELL